MTLNQILYFQKIANLENYHQAAEELYISQPSLSRSMASLENELGVTLFEKEGRGVTLTKAGRMFLEYADRILTDCHIAVGKCGRFRWMGERSTSVTCFRWPATISRTGSSSF
ncbi:LysR family transcriptional regulator [uncultured Clostridium sp.]|uniref:LysR family transcriptional regulator n=1 Tax=uncultured Clostridium sp. TaxID=59620 RepID=UPI00265F93E1|nr:LysR family transcriptional regulator [uncultured Clostridium sp.]